MSTISLLYYLFFFFFFFFQAEDGIRDKLVTGVQTCALPISAAAPERLSATTGRYDPRPAQVAAVDESGDPRFRLRHGVVHGAAVPRGSSHGPRPLRGRHHLREGDLLARAVCRGQSVRAVVPRGAVRRRRIPRGAGARPGSCGISGPRRPGPEAERISHHHERESPRDQALDGPGSRLRRAHQAVREPPGVQTDAAAKIPGAADDQHHAHWRSWLLPTREFVQAQHGARLGDPAERRVKERSEEHTSELQSL